MTRDSPPLIIYTPIIPVIMWHVLPRVPRIYLCVEDMDALIVVDFITKVSRAKIVQEQDYRFLDVLDITFISILSLPKYPSVFLFIQKKQHLFSHTFQEIETP